MPTPLLGAVIGAGANVAGQRINALSGLATTGLQLYQNRKLYEQQYRDNIAFWRLQNAYNTPAAQMQRFKEAGLNPHLIYSQGNAGNAGAINTPVQESAQFTPPNFGDGIAAAGTSLSDYFDYEVKQAQVDNLRAQNAVIQQDAILRAAQIDSITTRTKKDVFDLGFKTELRETSADMMREQLRQIKTKTDISIDENARRAALTAKTLEQAAQNLINSKAQYDTILLGQRKTVADTLRSRAETSRANQSLQNAIKDGRLKDYEIKLREKGLTAGDPTWTRVTATILDSISKTGSISESLYNYLFN